MNLFILRLLLMRLQLIVGNAAANLNAAANIYGGRELISSCSCYYLSMLPRVKSTVPNIGIRSANR